MRDLSLLGRILLSKAEGMSRSVYVSMPKNIVKDLDKILYDFIWKRKTHYVRKYILNNSKELGGLEVLNCTDLNEVFKIKWIIEYIKNKDIVWHIFPNFIFNSLGGMHFLLKCNFSVDKIPIKLASFHKQALLAWLLVYKHNFTPHRYFPLNNRDIKRNLSLISHGMTMEYLPLVSCLMNMVCFCHIRNFLKNVKFLWNQKLLFLMQFQVKLLLYYVILHII